METESVFHNEDEKEVIFHGEDSTVDLNNEITSSSEPNDQVTKEKQHGCIISAAEVEMLDTKSPNTIKGSKNNVLNTNKLAKNLSNSKGTAVFGRNTKPGLSKSLSFPARGRHSDVMKRSIELHPVKTRARQNHKNGPKVESKYSKVDSSSGSSLNSSEKVSSPKAAGRRTTLPSSSSLRQSISVKHASANGTAPNLAPEVNGCRLIEKSAESGNNVSLPAKEDDAQSTTSSNATPRSQKNNIPIFRLEERAEKRKEFLSKIEEKIHAKEVEKSNLQARSKENQEAEIKQLRKSLTFKATPMPSFYKEPPAKVELKKLPTTRPISPKLGRNKGIASISSNTHDNGGLHRGDAKSQKIPLRNSEKGNAILKKSIKNSIAKSQSRESSTPRKVKLAETEDLEETQNRPHCIVESLEEPIQEGGEVYR
ncbi:uncharacterized protein [Primulina eburnea]|uniref:uncharacterized protein isoform X1 n=1 Tax=Primulina eburnea TaxID=1245227 RepID=UPI003C6C4D3F